MHLLGSRFVADPHHAARHTILPTTLPGEVETWTVPKLSEIPGEVRWDDSCVGTHTDAVLAEIGHWPDDIARLHLTGAVA